MMLGQGLRQYLEDAMGKARFEESLAAVLKEVSPFELYYVQLSHHGLTFFEE